MNAFDWIKLFTAALPTVYKIGQAVKGAISETRQEKEVAEKAHTILDAITEIIEDIRSAIDPIEDAAKGGSISTAAADNRA